MTPVKENDPHVDPDPNGLKFFSAFVTDASTNDAAWLTCDADSLDLSLPSVGVGIFDPNESDSNEVWYNAVSMDSSKVELNSSSSGYPYSTSEQDNMIHFFDAFSSLPDNHFFDTYSSFPENLVYSPSLLYLLTSALIYSLTWVLFLTSS